MKKHSQFPLPNTRGEMIALEPHREKYEKARTGMAIAGIALAGSGLTIAADKLHNSELSPISYAAAGFAGAAGLSPLARHARDKHEALARANESVSVSPTDLPQDMFNHKDI